MKTLHIIFLLLFFSVLHGCASNEPSNKSIQDLIAAHKAQGSYLKVMNDFMISAKNKNIDEMIFLTSQTTISKNGIKAIKQLYKNTIIPEISSCKKLYTHKNVSIVRKETIKIGTGYIYNKICQKDNKDPSIINIMILKEKERISLAAIYVLSANKPNQAIKKKK